MNRAATLLLVCAGAALVMICGAVDDAFAQRGTQGVIYKQTTVGGSDAITISNESRYYHREKCKIYTDMTISSVSHNGHRRNNPDGTFYPGDALRYNIGVRFEGCSVVKPCRADVVPNNGVACIPPESICVSRRQGCQHVGFSGLGNAGPRSESGTVKIPSNIYGPDESYSVTKESYALAKFVGRTRYGAFSGYALISSIANYPVNVIDPELSTRLSQAPLTDSDGYTAANLDGTYYVWDPIHVIHKTDYRWKDERIGTISATHKMAHGILDSVHQFTCKTKSCTHTVDDLRGYDPLTLKHRYGGGNAVYNSTCVQGAYKGAGSTCGAYHGAHDITYESALHNIGGSSIRTGSERASSIYTTTDPLIVQYLPEFSSPYPYISLKDDASASDNWSWSKRHVVAVQYMGSTGGGRDDTDMLHKQRRALFNTLDYSGNALFLTDRIPIDATLEWSKTAGVSGADDERCDSHDENLIDDVLLFGRRADSAMFTQAGYGRAYFAYDITDFMQKNNSQRAILNNTLQTANFAGEELRDLVSYSYTYPAAQFGVPASIVMTDSEGIVEHGSISAKISPLPYDPGSFDPNPYARDLEYLHDHICHHVYEETGDTEYPNLVVSDMYPRAMSVHADTGGRVNYMLNRTSVIFSDVYALFADSTADLDINSIYEAPSAYDFLYGIDDGTANRTRTITSGVTFASPLLEIANIDSDNVLDHTMPCAECPHTTLQIQPRPEFGRVDTIEHNGKLVEALCDSDGCTLSALKGHENNVRLTNMWGGTASTALFVPSTDAASGLSIDAHQIATVVLIGIGALVVWRAFGALFARLRAEAGAE